MTDWHNPNERERAMAAKWAEAENKVRVLREALEAVMRYPEIRVYVGGQISRKADAALESTK